MSVSFYLQNFTFAVVSLRKERKSSEFPVVENREWTGTSVICETFIPCDCRIYFYVPGSRNFVQWCGERVKKGKETKKRGTDESRRSADYSTYFRLSLHFAAFRSHTMVFYVFAKSRFARRREEKQKIFLYWRSRRMYVHWLSF